VSKKAAAAGLSGLEFACGIPGLVGGAAVMNAGAFNSSVSDIIDYVEVLREKEVVRLNKSECGFSYRQSSFKNNDIVSGVKFSLKTAKAADIDLKLRRFREFRNQTQPVGHSAGSTFKAVADADLPSVKIPAAFYIDRAGLKGRRVGGAVVSEKHANFIINTGAASANDIRALIAEVKRTVYNEFGVRLEEEIRYLGDF
jgi:UDP-N-acetylmuramate dehydrogenase